MIRKNWRALPLYKAYWFQEGPGVRNTQFTDAGIKLLNVANIGKDGELKLEKTSRYLSVEEVDKRYRHFLVDENDLLIASSGIAFDHDGYLRTRGAFATKKHLPLVMNTSTIRFKAIAEISDSRFLRRWLQTTEFRQQITRLVTGSAQQNFGPSHLKQTNISLPSLEEQRRIAAILDQADALLAKRQKALARLDTFTQSLFLEMFGDPLLNSVQWPSAFLRDACSKITDGTHHSPEPQPNGVPYVTAKHVGTDSLDFYLNPTFVSERDHQEIYRRCDPKRGDVLYIKDGATTGRAAVNHYDFPFSMLSSLALLRPDPSVCTSEFLCAWLNNSSVKEKLLGGMAGAAIRRLTLSKIKDFRIIIPPIEKQKTFDGAVSRLRRIREKARLATEKGNALFDALQHLAFRGEL